MESAKEVPASQPAAADTAEAPSIPGAPKPRNGPGPAGAQPAQLVDDEMIRLVAELYYVRDQSQSTIADLTGFSVSKVSRLLSQARETGLVRITVEPAADQLERLATEMAQALAISDAHVTPGRSDDPVRATRLCAVAGAPWVGAQIPEAGVLGLAGGYTIAALVDALPPGRCAHLTIVPLVGGWDPATRHLDINELARRTAERLGSRYQLLHAPGQLDSVEVKEALLADSAREVVKLDTPAGRFVGTLGPALDEVWVERATTPAGPAREVRLL